MVRVFAPTRALCFWHRYDTLEKKYDGRDSTDPDVFLRDFIVTLRDESIVQLKDWARPPRLFFFDFRKLSVAQSLSEDIAARVPDHISL